MSKETQDQIDLGSILISLRLGEGSCLIAAEADQGLAVVTLMDGYQPHPIGEDISPADTRDFEGASVRIVIGSVMAGEVLIRQIRHALSVAFEPQIPSFLVRKVDLDEVPE